MVMEGGMHALHVAPRQTGSTQQPLQLAVMLSAVSHGTRPTCMSLTLLSVGAVQVDE